MQDWLQKFIKRRKVALIGSVDENGYPNIKAMLSPRKIDGNDFYFSTNTSSLRVGQFAQNPKACLYFYRKGLFKYQGVMLTGVMEILTDPAIKQELWQVGDSMFYKKGVTDPDYCVLHFKAATCRYYCDLKTTQIEL